MIKKNVPNKYNKNKKIKKILHLERQRKSMIILQKICLIIFGKRLWVIQLKNHCKNRNGMI